MRLAIQYERKRLGGSEEREDQVRLQKEKERKGGRKLRIEKGKPSVEKVSLQCQ